MSIGQVHHTRDTKGMSAIWEVKQAEWKKLWKLEACYVLMFKCLLFFDSGGLCTLGQYYFQLYSGKIDVPSPI